MKQVTVHVHNGIDYRVNTEGRCGWHLCTNNVYNSFDDPEEIKVLRVITLNEGDMGCEHDTCDRFTCGTCQRSWCYICNPTPAARCPYEYAHDEVTPIPGEVIDSSDLASVKLMVDGEWVDFRPVADVIDLDKESVPGYPEYEAEFLDERIVNDIIRENALRNQQSPQANGPCPVCNESGGFHNDDAHRNVDPKYLLEKGWHQSK